MKRGKVSDTILDRSVFKLLGRRGNTSKPAYGQDAAHIHNQGWDTLAAAATGSLAVYRAVNNISAAGGAAGAGADSAEHDALDKLVSEQLAERAEARKAKDFARADAIRDALGAAGIAIEDGPQGSTWSLK